MSVLKPFRERLMSISVPSTPIDLAAATSPSPNTPNSSPSSATNSPDDEPETPPDWSPTKSPNGSGGGVFSKFKSSNSFPLHSKKWPTTESRPSISTTSSSLGFTTPTWGSGLIDSRPRLTSRAHTAPPTFRRRIYRRDAAEQEYDGMPHERKAAANARVNNMRIYLGLKELDLSNFAMKIPTKKTNKNDGAEVEEAAQLNTTVPTPEAINTPPFRLILLRITFSFNIESSLFGISQQDRKAEREYGKPEKCEDDEAEPEGEDVERHFRRSRRLMFVNE
ncbi:hypothetical protein N0V83_002678 [Neocucurbitaria cava]|uniref:Uncharacterized protein n=1 Tax=Neocucurbitaria cava TaxID=798079 RepID=A0A9W9CPV3_9PLEO|nr:hypothetical protein N0V83_002678 [Neocucurbitaria cava]